MSDIDDFISDDEDQHKNVLITSKKSKSIKSFDSDDEDIQVDDDIENEDQKEDGNADDTENGNENDSKKDLPKETKLSKIDRLAKLRSNKKKKHKTGVIYFSSIPPYMKPAKMRQILTRFGEIDRLYLKREDDQRYKSRIKSGGNKKVKYDEGWAEFIRKRDAKLCAMTLNGNIIGGKKGSFYHDDILNVKYLPGFKWADLTEQITRENDIIQAKMELEMARATKINSDFIRNVEKSKMLQNIKSAKLKKNLKEDTTDDSMTRRDIKQNKVATNRAAAPEHIKNKGTSEEMDGVLSNLL
ncbi:hypothetical protein TBLA_0F00140 [Henningerozyma blattae CBS 6284]|uniref:Pre-rRNA-processing protein ESF2 n=1 Tax=Henningerozyma blattae (strain ATCC 34711 / CBS 6284 / DSM 70876 / NBRC 10599 / NRRL Y-10934 / UCD 77-7) TaxID=1071380 RepID=I2H5A6_HENB6|nr:hypothetical protein TBLA_0F00140 [Tetrapisispora blattae CBS 6284]CCH61558.1 hypothetical protein TBLA_0F00140 [Tetrapisispora blattae CBS 6284]